MTKPYRLPIKNGQDRAKARAAVDRVPVGWVLVFKPPVRSLDQNARLWAFLDDIAAQKEWDGKKRTSEQWKDLFSACLRQQEIVRGLEGGLVAFGARTSEMSPEEMSDLLQLIETWGAENGVAFTDTPQDNPAGTVASTAPDHGSSPAPAADKSISPAGPGSGGQRSPAADGESRAGAGERNSSERKA